MNSHQRRLVRRLTQRLAEAQAYLDSLCPMCGKQGPHWSRTDFTWPLAPLFQTQQVGNGFWSCADLYGEDGKRKDMSDAPAPLRPNVAGVGMASIMALARLGRTKRIADHAEQGLGVMEIPPVPSGSLMRS